MKKPKEGEVKAVSKRQRSATPKKATSTVSSKLKKGSIRIEDKTMRKIPVTAKKEDARKIKIIENITKRKPVVAPAVSKTRVLAASRISLALMIPFKLPLDQSHLVSNVARYAGTAFVMIGAFFTVYNMSAALSGVSESMLLTAQTTTSTCISGTTCDPTQTISTTTNTTISPSGNTQPNADIRVEFPSNTLTGTVPVNVTIPYASRVDVIAINKSTHTTAQVGTTFRVSDLVWRTYWNTVAVDDGTYRLSAIVTNPNGTYTNVGSTDYIVLNHPLTETQTTSSDSSPTTTTSTATTASTTSSGTVTATTTNTATDATMTPSLKVTLSDSEPFDGTVELRMYVDGAEKVPVHYRKANTTSYTLLGYATLHSTGEWRYEWDTTKLSDGDFDVRVQAIFPNGTSASKSLSSLTVLNASAADPTAASSTPVNTTTSVSPIPSTTLEPTLSLVMNEENPLEGGVEVYLTSTPLRFVEMYVLPERSLTPQFLGLAEKQSDSSWRFRFDTRNLPNGSYALFARAGHQYGTSESSPTAIKIYNVPQEEEPEEASYIESLRTTADEVESTLTPLGASPDEASSDSTEESAPVDTSPLGNLYTTLKDEVEDDSYDSAKELVDSFRSELDRIIAEYTKALRQEDSEKIRALQNELEEMRGEMLKKLPLSPDSTDVITRVNEQLGLIIKDLRERVERSETLIKERVGDAVTKDSDSDGISDYDEVNLYGTDPFLADSDQDGFIDGIEVLNGFDPLNEKREANVQYESPREQGVVREDLLTIDEIATIDIPEANEPVKAHFGGKALPNSFVTLYIFSTPIVVTVKSDSEGNWSYIFDKELDDGSHEVYVGITDNAGRIVAKSNPLSFVKTAEAFTPVDAAQSAVVAPNVTPPGLMSRTALLVVGSLAIVSIGLVLILLGLHVRPRGQEFQLVS